MFTKNGLVAAPTDFLLLICTKCARSVTKSAIRIQARGLVEMQKLIVSCRCMQASCHWCLMMCRKAPFYSPSAWTSKFRTTWRVVTLDRYTLLLQPGNVPKLEPQASICCSPTGPWESRPLLFRGGGLVSDPIFVLESWRRRLQVMINIRSTLVLLQYPASTFSVRSM